MIYSGSIVKEVLVQQVLYAYYIYMCVHLSSALIVEFAPTSYTVPESGRFANITIVKRGQTTLAVNVDFTTSANTAIG